MAEPLKQEVKEEKVKKACGCEELWRGAALVMRAQCKSCKAAAERQQQKAKWYETNPEDD